jgi:hypothetical protein
MKGNTFYIIILCLCLVLIFLIQYMLPHKFVWEATYDKRDKEPFGSYVFDDIVSSSIDGYTITDRTFYRIAKEDSATCPQAFLITEHNVNFTDTDIEYLYQLLHAGNQVMICATYFPYRLEDTLCFQTDHIRYFPAAIAEHLRQKRTRDSLFFGTDTLHPEYIYEVYPEIHSHYLVESRKKRVYEHSDSDSTGLVDDTLPAQENTTARKKIFPINCDSTETLVRNKENKPHVIRAFIGKGELFLVSTPLMFTNYNMLDGDNASYVFRLLSYMKNRPLTRIEAYGDRLFHNEKAHTPLRYVLSKPPLRWAVYSALILLVLFTEFTAKRRQRIIPVIKAPVNRTVAFMQLISNLYYQRHENGEILKMKHLYFCAEVKRLTGIDLLEGTPDEADYTRLSEKTGKDRDALRTSITNIRMAVYRSDASDEQLKEYIDAMNDLLYVLKS